MTEPLPRDVAVALSARPGLAGCSFHYASIMTSTNEHAALLAASGVTNGTTVIADRQTAGRGRRGHSWHSPPGVGLYMSVILRQEYSPVVTLLAGVVVAESVRALTGVAVELKWPNDIIVRNSSSVRTTDTVRKVAGILAEVLPFESGRGMVLGIGVNVGSSTLPAELVMTATSLKALSGRSISRWSLCADIRVRLDQWLLQFSTSGPRSIIERWQTLAPTSQGTMVSWDDADVRLHGRTAGIDPAGALLVVCDGSIKRIIGGELVWEL